MKACQSCAAENREAAVFCDSCGSRLDAAPAHEEQRKTVTALFCDVSESTALGERLDPESVRRLMARYFARATQVIEGHGGTVEKFIGDAVMAIFGVPTVHEDDALRAVRAADDLRRSVSELNVEFERDFGTSLKVRIGVNTGEVVTVGDELLATGDAINVASHLEHEAPPGGILIGSATLNLTRDAIEVGPREVLVLKGKSEPVATYPLLSVTSGSIPIERRFEVPMMGRSRELQALSLAFRTSTETRSCHLFTILGSAGVGKSRLVHEFLQSVGDAAIVRGNCLSYGEGITYWPIIAIIKELEPRLDQLLADVRARSVLRGLLSVEQMSSSSEEIAWSFRKLIEAYAAERPVVCVLDDIQWGEPNFLDLVESIADLSRDAPIFVLCMARPELLDKRPVWAGGKLNATSILLDPLLPEETRDLIEHLALRASIDESTKASIAKVAEGNPFFCEQLIAFTEESVGQTVKAPSTVQALIAARLDQLEPVERQVLARGAVEGRIFHRDAVEFLGVGESNIERVLTSLVRRDLIRPHPSQFAGQEAFRFRHLLIRDAAYEGIAKSTRAKMHESFARWMERYQSEVPELDELRGYHLEQAYRYLAELGPVDEAARSLGVQAATLLHRAGRRARERGDIPGSLNLLSRAVDLLPDTSRPADLDLDYVQSLCMAGEAERGVDVAALGERRAASMGDVVGALKLRLEQARQAVYLLRDDGEALQAAVEDALPVFEAAGDDEGLVAAFLGLSELQRDNLRLADGAASAERAYRHARAAGDEGKAGEALIGGLAARIGGPQSVVDVLAWCNLQSLPALAEPMFCVLKAQLLAMTGDLAGARELAEQSVAKLRKLALLLDLAVAAGSRWVIEMYAGDVVEAERIAREGSEAFAARGEKGAAAWLACRVADSLLARDHVEEASRWLQTARQESVRPGPEEMLVTARVQARSGAVAEAIGLARTAIEMVAESDALGLQADLLMGQAEVSDYANDIDAATQSRKQALELYTRKGNLVGAGRARTKLAAAPTVVPYP